MTDKAARAAEAARMAEAVTEAAVQERGTVLKELDDLKNTVVVLAGQAVMSTGQAAKAKKEVRRSKVTLALSFVNSAAGRRSV